MHVLLKAGFTYKVTNKQNERKREGGRKKGGALGEHSLECQTINLIAWDNAHWLKTCSGKTRNMRGRIV